ncbi:MerR family transcriptional regulator [Tropicibacter oceani]|uniref:MerR family transcriptional regulator n=1 Tax=Tropicibacter oceani TaxID=3058420 RepID=A0ABY8QFF6_9RHOB|nr:MerR family transcriptional regulator [Tropicibacter oceani]WGW02753.1 MerR family transcriptional regulator [Tropicibacter oceani]
MAKSRDAFRTISEVAEWLDTPAHVLRFWESKFTQVKPVKRAGGRRYYRPADMELLGGIKKLLHDDGMTIKGVQKVLREQGVRHVSSLSEQHVEGGDNYGDLIEDAPYIEVESEPLPDTVVSFNRTPEPNLFDETPPDDLPEAEEVSAPDDLALPEEAEQTARDTAPQADAEAVQEVEAISPDATLAPEPEEDADNDPQPAAMQDAQPTFAQPSAAPGDPVEPDQTEPSGDAPQASDIDSARQDTAPEAAPSAEMPESAAEPEASEPAEQTADHEPIPQAETPGTLCEPAINDAAQAQPFAEPALAVPQDDDATHDTPGEPADQPQPVDMEAFDETITPDAAAEPILAETDDTGFDDTADLSADEQDMADPAEALPEDTDTAPEPDTAEPSPDQPAAIKTRPLDLPDFQQRALPDVPDIAPAPAQAGPLSHLAQIEALDDNQVQAIRAMLPALRALAERPGPTP